MREIGAKPIVNDDKVRFERLKGLRDAITRLVVENLPFLGT